jgi:hypothetical protein
MSTLKAASKILSKEEVVKLFSSGSISWKALKNILLVAPKILNGTVKDSELDVAELSYSLKRAVEAIPSKDHLMGSTRKANVNIAFHDGVRQIRHTQKSPLAKTSITVAAWNTLPNVIKVDITGTRTGKSTWPRNIRNGHATTLYDHIITKINGASLVMYHGTLGRFESSVLSDIRWDVSNGVMGRGFYMTHNPNVAKAYACRQAALNGGLRKNENLLVLELKLTNAKSIKYVPYDSKEFSRVNAKTATFTINNNTGFDGQVAVRGTATKHIKILNMHILDFKVSRSVSTDDMKIETC